MVVVVLAVLGLPAAGKSTLIDVLCERVPRVRLVRFDDFEDSRMGRSEDSGVLLFDSAQWQESRREAYDAVVEAIASLDSEPPSEVPGVVVVDDNLYYRSMRRPLLRSARAAHAAFAQLYLMVSPETASRRNTQRARPVPEQVIFRMAALFEEPVPKSSPLDQHCLQLSGEESPEELEARLPEIIGFLHSAATAPQPSLPTVEELAAAQAQAEASRRCNAESLRHQVDLASRRAMGEVLSYSEKRGDAGKQLSKCRRDYLEELRRGRREVEAFVDVSCEGGDSPEMISLADPRAASGVLSEAMLNACMRDFLCYCTERLATSCPDVENALLRALRAQAGHRAAEAS